MRLSIKPNERVTFKIRYESEAVLVIDKPCGLVTQPGLGHDRSSLMNGLFVKYGPELQKLGTDRDYGLLHRLDKETSGLVMVARTIDAYDTLRAAFEAREIRKFYWAVVKDRPKADSGVIKKPLAEFQGTPQSDRRQLSGGRTLKLCRVSSAGKVSATAYRVLGTSVAASLLECRALTGRLHQVRVHLASIGCPILGDDYYAMQGPREAASRLALHAHRIVFANPIAPGEIDIRSPFPKELRGLMKKLGLAKPEMVQKEPDA